MSHTVPCLLYTADAELARRVLAYAAAVTEVVHHTDAVAIKRAVQQHAFAVLLFDIRGADHIDLLRTVLRDWPQTLAIVIGATRSDPVLEALDLGVYGALPFDVPGAHLEQILRQAQAHQHLAEEIAHLQTLTARAPRPEVPAGQMAGRDPALFLRQFLRPLRNFDDVASLLQGIVDGVASATMVLRAGIFAATEDGEGYAFRAGVGCLDETRAAVFRRDAPLVRWLELNAQVASRHTLDQLRNPADHTLLRRALDSFGAELIVPLHGRSAMLGWLLVGRRATGVPFTDTDILDLVILCEHVSTSLENALLYREVGLQKAFAETLLRSLPTGVIAVDADGRVYWVNESAEIILDVRRHDVIGKPAERLGTRIALPLRASLAGAEGGHDAWEVPQSRQFLTVRTASLMSGLRCTGAVAFIDDRTREQLLNRRQQELERAAFWTELAASMSHEIRNPMVAIKTFAQLLPERYTDPEFRTEFSTLVAREVDRLNAIIQQINSFASRPQLSMDWVSVRELLDEGRHLAAARVPTGEPAYAITLDERLPRVRGDRRALAECFAHIFANASEALHQKADGRITVAGSLQPAANGTPETISIVISDNAGGIPKELRDNVFSPFCTSKARAMGLGLPIVQRTMADHHGHVAIHHTGHGTEIHLALPVDHQQLQEAPV